MADIDVTDNRIEVKNVLENAAIAFLNEAAGEVQSAAQRNSRVKTGQTRGSYEYQVDESGLEAEVGSGLENAIWEEFGTGEYALHGDGRKGGWAYQDEKGEFHRTRGKAPNRPLYNAFSVLREKIIKMAEEKFKGIG